MSEYRKKKVVPALFSNKGGGQARIRMSDLPPKAREDWCIYNGDSELDVLEFTQDYIIVDTEGENVTELTVAYDEIPEKEEEELDLTPITTAIKNVEDAIYATESEEKDDTAVINALEALKRSVEAIEPADIPDYTKQLEYLFKAIVEGSDRSAILDRLDALLLKETPTFEIPPQLISDNRIRVEVDRIGGGGGSDVTYMENLMENGVAITGSDTAYFDAFGRQRVSNTGQRFDVEFIYDKQDEIMDERTVGAGTVTHDTNARDLTLAVGSTTSGDLASMDSYPIPYTAGNSQLIDVTGVLNYANIAGGSAELFFRTKVSGTVVTTTYPQAEWENLTSGVNWNYSHILSMDFQSLKVGRIRFYLVQNGLPVKLKEIYNDNVRNTGYWQTPSLPVSWIIYNDSTYTYMEMGYGDANNGIGIRYKVPVNASATMKAICATVKSEGGKDLFDMPGFPRACDRGVTAKTISTSLVPLLSIRPRQTFNSLPNLALSIPIEVSVTTDNPIKLVIMHHNTLTNASWNNVDTTESVMEFDVAATAYSNGHILYSEYISAGKNTQVAGTGLLGRSLLHYHQSGDSCILTIAAIRTGASDASVLASVRWKEIR